MIDKILVNLGTDHTWECPTYIIGREGEGNTTRFEITVPDKLIGWSVYLDFTKPNGEKLRTPKLMVDNGVAYYDVVPYLLTDGGDIKVQAVLEQLGKTAEERKTWKSSNKTYHIQDSIDALEEIPDKEDFMSEAYAVLDEIRQLKPNYAESEAWLEEHGDTDEIYVLCDPTSENDGMIYAYKKTEVKVEGHVKNCVPSSIDTDGSTYNDCGYKEDVRLSSSGGISGTPLEGSVTTGFIPYTYTDIVRMKGASWLGAPTPSLVYFNVYDADKKFVYALSASGLSYFTGASVVYDEATGITTFDFSKGNSGAEWYTKIQGASYFRINAMGKGEDLVVTVNSPIEETETIVTTYRWENTGHAFVPADYEDRIIELEEENMENAHAITELGQQVNNILDGTSEITASTKFDPTIYSNSNFHYSLPILHLTGDISPIVASKDNKVNLSYVYGKRSGSCTLKAQGNTSYTIAKELGKYGKYNYTITFDNAFEAHDGWGAQKKYCFKANWNDPSQARNVVSAKLWGLMAKSRADVPAQMAVLPNAGAVDGFPCIIMLNDEFHGLYTFNIPKDEWMFGFGNGTKEAFISADNPANDTLFKGETLLNADGMELEYSSDSFSETEVKGSLNTLINACLNTNGGDLDTTVAQYLDWASAIDIYILTVVMRGADNVGKNFLMATYDGTKWYFVPYDMDLTWGTEFGWSKVCRPVSNVDFAVLAKENRIYELIKQFKIDDLKARYNALRADTLSVSRIIQYFENFGLNIPLPVMIEDMKLYPSIPASSVCTIDQIARWVVQRLEICDEWIEKL